MSDPKGALGDEKCCVVCGRRFGWRKRWAEEWARIRHCSPRCTNRRLTSTDHDLERAILDLLRQEGAAATVSPSDAARAVSADWRALSERVRDAARRLCARGEIEFLQGGQAVDASSAKGPVLLRLRPR